MLNTYKHIVILILLFSCLCAPLQARTTKGCEVVGSVYLNSPFGNYIADIGIIKTWRFGKYLSLGTGAKLSYTQTDNLTCDWFSNTQRYGFDFDKSIVGLQGVGIIEGDLPVTKGFGIYGNAVFSFELLPWDYLEVRKYRSNSIDYDSKTIYAYNHFAPRFLPGCGIYKDIKTEKSTMRIAIGYSYGYYDALPGCRKKTYEGQNLGEHLPCGDYLHNISFKITFF